IYFSRGLGLLAYPPYQDGIGYVIMAKSFFYRLGHEPLHVLAEMAGGRAPLWGALLVFTFAVLCEGEWQAYALRFWPPFPFLLLIFKALQARGLGSRIPAAVAMTAVLPIFSVTARATLSQYLSGEVDLRTSPYLADLRPDLLFAILLLWTTVPLIERRQCLD